MESRITYLGVAINTDAHVVESREGEVVVETATPMPVGTELSIDLGERLGERLGQGPAIARVLESVEGAPGRMRLATEARRAEKPAPSGERRRSRRKTSIEPPTS